MQIRYMESNPPNAKTGREKVMETILSAGSGWKPAYKIMITKPDFDSDGNVKSSVRSVLCDTSRKDFKNFMGRSNQQVVGIWVDESDLGEPDKAIVLLENELVTSSDGGGNPLEESLESLMMNFSEFGVRNWLDIWLGYVNVTTGGFLSNVKAIKGLGVPTTYPDEFYFGNESHVFSGPIVSIRRKMTGAGDRVQIIGFSPTIIFKSTGTNGNFQISGRRRGDNFKSKASTGVGEGIKKVLEAVGKEGENKTFSLGQFYYGMWTGDEEDKLRVVPFMDGVGNKGSQYYDADLVYPKLNDQNKFYFSLTRDETAQRGSLYDWLFVHVCEDANTKLANLYVKVVKGKWENEEERALTDGVGHPGFFLRYGFRFGVEEILRLSYGGELVPGRGWAFTVVGSGLVLKKRYGDEMVQRIRLGVNAKEFNLGMEYGTTFNERNLSGKFKIDVEEKSEAKEGEEAQTTTLHRDKQVLTIPTGPFFNEALAGSGFLKKGNDLWNPMKADIKCYGKSTHPIPIWGFSDEAVHLDSISEEFVDVIIRRMKESYFGGLTGTAFLIGDPSFKPHRLVEILDQRFLAGGLFSSAKLRKAANFKANLTSKLLSFRKKEKKDEVKHLRYGGLKTGEVLGRKLFYAWKTRHYVGVKSGYTTKVYFTETRNREWQKQTTDIDGIIRAALLQARQDGWSG